MIHTPNADLKSFLAEVTARLSEHRLVRKLGLWKIQDARFLLQLMLLIQKREQNVLPVLSSLVPRNVVIPVSDGFRQASRDVRFFGDFDDRLEVRPYREHECLGARKSPQALPL
jgi:hypothetical protein